MRIAPPGNSIPAYVKPMPPVPAVPLTPEASRALIASGVFDHNPNQVVWAAEKKQLPLGGPTGSVASVALPGGVNLQGWRTGQADDSLLATLLDTARQMQPVLEQSGPDVAAESVALLVASPEILKALQSSERGAAENVALFGTSLLSAAKIVNHFTQIPHVDTALDAVGVVFKVGEQVFLAGGKKAESA